MKILGISAHYHDSAAALVVDGVPVCAVQEERLSRRKNDAGFPVGAIEWCLDSAGLEPSGLDAVVFYERSMLKFDRILTTALRAFPSSWRSFPHAIRNSLGMLPSEAGCPGAIQIPGDGLPITLMADAPTVGGYPKIAVVSEADLPILAQRRPGESIRFQLITIEQSQRALKRRASDMLTISQLASRS